MTRYVIIGAGGVGTSLAAQFALSGVPYVLVARPPGSAILRERPLEYRQPHGVTHVPVEVAEGPHDVQLTDDDVLVLATKAQDVEAVLRDWAWQPVTGTVGGDASALPIVLLQNGLDAERAALRRFETVIGGSVRTPARYVEPGVVDVAASHPVAAILLGRYPQGAHPAVDTVAADLRRADYAVQTTQEIQRWMAEKLLRSVTLALDVFPGADAARGALGSLLTAEAAAALQAAGISPQSPTSLTAEARSYAMVPGTGYQPGQRSTWQSVARGSGSVETDYLNGEVVLLGRLHGIPTPANYVIQRALGALVRDAAAGFDRQRTEVGILFERATASTSAVSVSSSEQTQEASL